MIISVNSINQLISVMVKCSAFSEVQTEFLNIVLDKVWHQRVKLSFIFKLVVC
jgi:hypothetical protein